MDLRFSYRLILLLFMILTPISSVYALPAFPGAEGFGSDTIGGRKGRIIKVTTTADRGEGSFREAVTAEGPRIVVFAVSGIIDLEEDIIVREPFMTLAGQTSPGGIIVSRRRFIIDTHDVVIQHMRFRLGTHGGLESDKHRAFEIYGDGNDAGGYYPDNAAYNIIVDHCSFSWAGDQVVSVAEDAYDVTISWSILSEGLNDTGQGAHSYAILYWGRYTEADRKYSFHHNYVAHCGGRTPEINYRGTLDAVNNVVYNYYGGKSPKTSGDARANWIHNYIKPGDDSNSPEVHFEARHDPGGTVAPNIYTYGNIGVRRLDQSNPEQWYVGVRWTGELLSQDWRSFDEVVASPVLETVMTYPYALEILETVGATKPIRDSVDQRVVADFDANTGNIIDTIDFAGFPTFNEELLPPDDLDHDGMADDWERTIGLNPDEDDSRGDHDQDEYTNIEEYLYYLSTGGDAVGDVSSPTCDIESPTGEDTYDNGNSASITLSGTASDDTGVNSVSWASQATSESGTATGTISWSAANIGLIEGENTIVITVTDGAGKTGQDLLVVTYAPDGSSGGNGGGNGSSSGGCFLNVLAAPVN